MPLELTQVTSEVELDEIISLLWQCYAEPRVPWLWLTFGIVGSSEEALQVGITRSREFFRNLHRNDPTSQWLKVVDAATGKVVGASRWHIYTQNPFEGKTVPKIEIDSWPMGDRRKYAEDTMKQFIEARFARYRGPYMGPQVFFVHPNHRRQGAATLMLNWGLSKADQLGLQSFVESTPWAVPFYKTGGYMVLKIDHTDVERTDPTPDWLFMQKEYGTLDTYYMWRPAGGEFIRGETTVPF